MKRALLLFFLSCSILSWAQIPNDFGYDDYKKKLPKEAFLFLNLSIIDVFDIKNGELYIYSDSKEKILCLNNNAVGLKSRSMHYDQFSELTNVEVYSHYPENGKYKKQKVKEFKDESVISNGISFYDDSKERKFTYQNFREGIVTSIEYRRIFKDPHLLYSRSFYSGIFIKKEEYVMKVHKAVDIGFHEFNIDEERIKYSSWTDGDYTYYKWLAENSEKEVIYGDDYYDLYYEPHIIPYIKTYKINGEQKNVFRNLDDLHAWYYSLIKQVKPSKNEELKQLADSITAGAETELEKVKMIYYWVQDKIKYIAFGDGYGGFIPRDPDVIFERRFGDCKDMSCLTINLLNELDITAYFTWVGTRMIPYSYSKVADPSVDNHMIATYIDKDKKKYFLDATNSNLEFGRASSSVQGKEVLISKGEKEYEIDVVPILDPKKNLETDTAHIKIEDGKIIGKGKFLFTGYLAEDVYREIKDLPEDKMEKHFNLTLSKGSNKFSSSNIKYTRPSDSKDSLQIDYEFEIDSYINEIEDNLYVNLNLTKQFKDFEIEKKQNIPMILDYKNYLEKVFYLEIPAGYEIDYLPKDLNTENDFLKASISYKVQNNTIVYNLKFEQKVIEVKVDEVPKWNEIVHKLSQNLDESIKLNKTKNE